MDEKRKGKLIYIVVVVPICLAELMAYCGCRVFIDILAYTYLIGGFSIALGTGLYCFYWKFKLRRSKKQYSPLQTEKRSRVNSSKESIKRISGTYSYVVDCIGFCYEIREESQRESGKNHLSTEMISANF